MCVRDRLVKLMVRRKYESVVKLGFGCGDLDAGYLVGDVAMDVWFGTYTYMCRCPLMGRCDKEVCVLDLEPGPIDMYRAVRDYGIVADDRQLQVSGEVER